MPPDVFLVLASSGLTLVASLLYFVSDERPPLELCRADVTFCVPPARPRVQPPPLPPGRPGSFTLRTVQGVLTMLPQGSEWLVTLESPPNQDAPAVQVGAEGHGSVHDLRWHGRAGLVRTVKHTWRQKPGRA